MLRSFSTQTASANIAGIARGLIRSGRIVEAAHLCQTSRDVAAVEASIGAILRPMLSSTSPPNSALLRPPAAPTSDAVSPADTAHGNGHQKQLPTLLFFLDHLYPPKPAPVAPTRPGGSGATDRLTLSRSLVSAEYAAPFYRSGYASAVTQLLRAQHLDASRVIHSFLLSRGVFPDHRVFYSLLKRLTEQSNLAPAYLCYRDYVDCYHRPSAQTVGLLIHALALKGSNKSLSHTSIDTITQRYDPWHYATLAFLPPPPLYAPNDPRAVAIPPFPTHPPGHPDLYRAHLARQLPDLPPVTPLLNQLCQDLRTRRIPLTAALLTSLLQCLVYSGEPLGGVRAIFDDMHHGPVQPNPVTYLVMMYGYARQAQPEPVAELLVQLQKVHPGQVTIAHYGVLMYAYSRANRVRGVLRVWDDIQARFRHPNAKVTNILLLALIRGGQPRLAIDVFQQLAHRISPSFFASSSHPPSPSTAPIPSATSYFPLSVLSPPSSPASALASAPTLSPTSTPTLTTITSPTSTPPPASPSPSSTPHPRTRASQRDEEHNASLLIRAHLLNNNLAEAWQMFGRIRCQDPTINSHILESFLRYFIKQSDLWSCERVFNTIDQSSVKSVYWVDYLQLITLAYENRHYILVARFYESMRQKYLNHFPPLLRSGEGSPLARHTLRNWPAFLHLVTGAKPPIATPPLLRGEPYRPICRVQDHQALAQPTMPNRLDGLAIPAAQNERIALGCLKAERPSLALLAYHDYLQYPGVQPIPALEEVFAHLSVAN
ncbi:hypothetical protein H4R33_000720 [Dimargaris cristalligena]|nr:hypothetical protein H4R33_000720 [Dimargaris cristalligena]